MSEAPPESIDIDALMRLVRDEARRRSKEHGGETISFDNDAVDLGVSLSAPQLFADIPYGKDTYTVAELTSSHGEAFVRNAYRALLRRVPDPQGMSHFMGLLRAGRSKLAVLGGIRYSAEGRRLAVNVPGLYRRHLAERVFGIPIIGPIAESLAALVSIRSMLVHHRALEETALSVAESVANASTQHANALAARLADTARSLSTLSDRSNAVAAELRSELGRQMNAMARQSDGVGKMVSQLDGDLKRQRATVQQALSDALQQAARIDALTSQMAAADARSDELLVDQGVVAKRVDRLAADAGHRWAPLQDAFYAAFEDQFRGTRADIKNRLVEYLPRIKAAAAGTATAPVIDLGCGRGEWLELLRDEGLIAHGCDTNRAFIDQCQKADLGVTHQDLFQYLETLADKTVGAVTSFHVVEHLPFADVIHLLDEAMRVLRPGGIVIMETPNPENLRVGACDFYLDPTHRNPIPAPMLEYVVRACRFADVEIVRLHPLASLVDDGRPDRFVRDVDALLQGPRDYAVVAKRPEA